jgi:hypothetical protein
LLFVEQYDAAHGRYREARQITPYQGPPTAALPAAALPPVERQPYVERTQTADQRALLGLDVLPPAPRAMPYVVR